MARRDGRDVTAGRAGEAEAGAEAGAGEEVEAEAGRVVREAATRAAEAACTAVAEPWTEVVRWAPVAAAWMEAAQLERPLL